MSRAVTVLLAVRNGGGHLRQAIDSVLAQTFEDFELLIVDDASTDGSAELAEGYADGRVRVLRNERNLGQIPSLNRGLAAAQGRYVARLDHDDVCLPRRLERQVEAFTADPGLGLVSCWVDIVEDARIWATIRSGFASYADFLARLVVDDVPLAHPAIMFPRDLVVELGGYDQGLGAAEDKDLYRRIALARRGAHVVPELLVLYRRHEGQMTYTKTALVNRNNEQGHDAFLAALAPAERASTLRMLFTGDERFWEEPPLDPQALHRFLEAAAQQQRLDPEERRSLARALADRTARTLAGGWAAGPRVYADCARPLAGFVAAHGGPVARAWLTLQPVLRATLPAGRAVGSGRRRIRRTLRRPALEPLRRAAKRSRTLRRIYTRVFGFRLLDD